MALHHILSLYLYGGSYMTNQLKGGGVMALLHDFSDIFAGLVKMLAETRFTNFTAGFFIITMIVWFWTRLVVLPLDSILGAYLYLPVFEASSIVKPALIYLISCMCMLHYYWFYLFCRMLKNYKKRGVAEDI